ncbi:ABC transporter ATP-binding protein [candidate division CSSED10-310 bacterium]|uniref:ABC transporter ATP-binding protein n=1 Tax=candidate division CSSED10-310 bacterium TaxID=2855610 RepID=A0ABV6YWH9_UNCC1
MEPIIVLENVCKAFGDKQVLKHLDLTIYPGESMVIIGGSGIGKSVTIKHIIGLLKQDSGAVKVYGQEVSTLSERELYSLRKNFGMLFQGAALFDSLTIAENVSFVLDRHTRLSKAEKESIVSEKLQMVGMSGYEKKKPADLSGGMKKRVGLARAIAFNPEIMLYDEPTTGLDPIMGDIINNLIVRLNRELNITSVTITHDMNSAYKIADRIAMIYQGKIIEINTPDQIKNSKNPIVSQFVRGEARVNTGAE